MQGGEDKCYYGDEHVTGDNHFILDVPHLLHGVVILFYLLRIKFLLHHICVEILKK